MNQQEFNKVYYDPAIQKYFEFVKSYLFPIEYFSNNPIFPHIVIMLKNEGLDVDRDVIETAIIKSMEHNNLYAFEQLINIYYNSYPNKFIEVCQKPIYNYIHKDRTRYYNFHTIIKEIGKKAIREKENEIYKLKKEIVGFD